eukprot:Unigene1374_Nuclearia_a/m.4364 Unigene1374_Nuclearia_a/g.4364  ORF Unigene1374_Nuclearia_a/g.4364 Unigene1374_Nuclearia_a/m.4364 type:complete len:371 (+) Unigene1374_Nuclearia_a:309-1421(+)
MRCDAMRAGGRCACAFSEAHTDGARTDSHATASARAGCAGCGRRARSLRAAARAPARPPSQSAARAPTPPARRTRLERAPQPLLELYQLLVHPGPSASPSSPRPVHDQTHVEAARARARRRGLPRPQSRAAPGRERPGEQDPRRRQGPPAHGLPPAGAEGRVREGRVQAGQPRQPDVHRRVLQGRRGPVRLGIQRRGRDQVQPNRRGLQRACAHAQRQLRQGGRGAEGQGVCRGVDGADLRGGQESERRGQQDQALDNRRQVQAQGRGGAQEDRRPQLHHRPPGDRVRPERPRRHHAAHHHRRRVQAAQGGHELPLDQGAAHQHGARAGRLPRARAPRREGQDRRRVQPGRQERHGPGVDRVNPARDLRH